MESERQGSRWLYAPPSETEIQDWFKGQRLHESLSHEHYVGGIVVISAVEKMKVTAEKQNGDSYVKEVERTVYTPYVKVDTRIGYFWDLVQARNAEDNDHEYVGVIEPVDLDAVIDVRESAYYNEHLPTGYGIMPVRHKQGDGVTNYLFCTQRVRILRLGEDGSLEKGTQVLVGTATKQVPMTKQYPDDNSMMKAETGAVGRALGMAGVLVVGTGVASAEDMQEQADGPSGGDGAVQAAPPTPAAPPAVVGAETPGDGPQAPSSDPGGVSTPEEAATQTDDELREHAKALQGEMEANYPKAWEAYKAWWASREFGPLSGLTGPALKGAVIKLERDLDAAKNPPPADG